MLDDIDLPKDLEMMVVIPEQDDEREVNGQLQSASENETGNYARRVVLTMVGQTVVVAWLLKGLIV